MSLAFRYLLGVAACVGAGAVAAWVAAPAHRAGALWGVFAGVVLQAPLGWITLRAIGTDRFMLVWGVGMLVRLGAVRFADLILVPVLDAAAADGECDIETTWDAGDPRRRNRILVPVLGPGAPPMLVAMVGVLGALLVIEGIVAMREHSGEDGE